MRCALVLAGLVLLGGCKALHRKTADAGADAAMVVVVVDAGPPQEAMRSVDPEKDLPLGHYETTDGPKLCLSLLPYGLVRFATLVPSYRIPARVFGQIKHAEALDTDTFQMTVEVTKILAKEIGSCHRNWNDYELFEAQILGERVTSPNENGHRIPSLDGGSHTEPPKTWLLKFDRTRETLEMCTTAPAPLCRKLTRKKSPSDFSRARTGAECKLDTDCVVVTDGEQCDPCLCPSRASVRSWPKRLKAEDKNKQDLSFEREPEHLCGRPIPRRDDCAECPAVRAVCKHKVCVLNE